MDGKMKIIPIKKKDSKLKFMRPNPNQKRLTQVKSPKKFNPKLSPLSNNNNKSFLITDTDISTRKTSDSLFNNKNRQKSNKNVNFVYKKNINRPKISIKLMKNERNNVNLKTEGSRRTLAHSSSTGFLNKFCRINNNNNNYDTNNNYFNIETNDNWILSPKKNNNNYKIFTQGIRDMQSQPKRQTRPQPQSSQNLNFKSKLKNINIYSITNLDSYVDNYNNNNNNNNINNKKNERYISPNKKTKKAEIINIEDLLLLDENFIEVINSIPTNFNISNNCFEFINIYINSSLICNFEKYFTDYQTKTIIHISIMIMIFNIIITYHISFIPQFLNTCDKFLINLLILSHKSFLLICQLISNVVSSSEQENIWVIKLRKMLEESITPLNVNDEDFISFLSLKKLKLVNDTKFNSLIEIKYYTVQIKKYLQLLLNIMNNNDNLKNDFCNLFKNIDNLSFNILYEFYNTKVLKIINKNASVTGKNASSYGGIMSINNVKAPYLPNKSNKKFTLVLDLDETLIAFKVDPNQENKGLLKFRPGLDYFLLKMKIFYEIIVFTSATQEYADPIENCIEQNEKYFDARLYRQHTIIYENDFVKDISRIGRDLDKIIIVDNMPQNFRLQKENGIFIKPFWGDDVFDTALFSLADILEKIYMQFDDVRKGIYYFKDEIINKVTSNFSKKKK